MITSWNGKPYHSLDYMLKERFGEKVYKVTLNGGMSCPNRDGTIGHGGCIFCSEGGSGDFAASAALSIHEQIDSQIAMLSAKRPIHKYIAYFQAYTNTYAPVPYLEKIFQEAISHPGIVALSIGTRPDCLEDDVVELLSRLNMVKPVWVELGLQTIHESTAAYIRRGYPLSCFEDSLKRLRTAGLEVVVHTILGLPGESREDMLATMDYLNARDIQGIKLQLLHVLKGTDLAYDYLAGKFKVLERAEYIDLVADCLEHLDPSIVIHRVTGDGPKDLLIAPLWASRKREVLNLLLFFSNTLEFRTYAIFHQKGGWKMATPFTVYKLIILYMLRNSSSPITNSEISEFILDREYTNYFHLQQALSELEETELIEKRTISNTSYYYLTEDGKNTLTYFENDISQDIRTEVLQYLAARGASTKNQVKAPADYYINNQGEYVVHLQLLQKGASVIDLSLAAPSLSAAKAICRQWPKKYEEIYAKIMEGLL